VRASGRVETIAEIEDIAVATRGGGAGSGFKDVAEVTLGRELLDRQRQRQTDARSCSARR